MWSSSFKLLCNPETVVTAEIWAWLTCSRHILTQRLRELRAAIETSPQDATLHYNLGLALKLKDLLADAVPELEKAAQLDPQQADIRYTLGVTLWGGRIR